MSRSGYCDDYFGDDGYPLEFYRQAVERAISGKRGQAFLRELATAMDSMPVKELISGELINKDGACCAIGAVCRARAIDVSRIDYEDPQSVGRLIGVARSMAAEIAYMNDEFNCRPETPGERWVRMRKWVDEQILKA